MKIDLEVGGRTRTITVDRTGDGFAVTIDGRRLHVNAAPVDAQTLSLLVDSLDGVSPDDGARSYEAAIANVAPAAGNGGPVTTSVTVGGIPVVVNATRSTMFPGASRPTKPTGGASGERHRTPGGSGPERISAPMPGKVVRVMAQPGDVVRARQPLVVVEAMKMENEVRAGRDGTVTEVRAREGQSVDAGALLIVIQ